MKILSLILSLIVGGGAVIENVWWSLSHNLENTACSNIIYHAHHIEQCATWFQANGIQEGVCTPLIILGLFGAIGSVLWIVFTRTTAE